MRSLSIKYNGQASLYTSRIAISLYGLSLSDSFFVTIALICANEPVRLF